MESSVIGDLLARERRSERPALSIPRLDRTMGYHDLLTTAYKAGNVLRYLGVSDDVVVALDPTPSPEPVLAFLGAAQLGATTTFDPRADSRLTLVPVADEDAYTPRPGSTLAVYGGPPASPATTHWEKALWSENPGFPVVDVDAELAALLADERTYSHRTLLSTAERVVEDLGLTAASRLAIRTPLSDPRTIAGGLLASLVAGATAVLDDRSGRDGDGSAAALEADAALVAPGVDPPEAAWLSTDDIELG
jgi:hypothetical protein